jgi:hypothetical protein
MSWVAVGVTAASVGVIALFGGQQGKKAADKQSALEEPSRREEERGRLLRGERPRDERDAGGRRCAAQHDGRAARGEARGVARDGAAAASGGGATSPDRAERDLEHRQRGLVQRRARALSGRGNGPHLRLQAFEKRQQGEFDMTQGSLSGEAARLRGSSQERRRYANMLSAGGGLYAKYGGRGTGDTPLVQESVAGQFSTGNPAYG